MQKKKQDTTYFSNAIKGCKKESCQDRFCVRGNKKRKLFLRTKDWNMLLCDNHNIRANFAADSKI